MLYKKIIRPLLFLIDAEKVHRMVFSLLKMVFPVPGVKAMVHSFYRVKHPSLERNLMGLKFQNPVGLAAGFDKDAKHFDELEAFDFGFIEIGTVTPEPQDGNPKPRLFRLPKDEALINRMGFNNEGALAAAKRLKKRKASLIIGGNIGKNKNIPIEEAVNDYIKCFNVLFDVVDYFAVNVSSPNTPNLRELQDKKPLTEILESLQKINLQKNKPKPILLKIAPDLTFTQLDEIIEIVRHTKIQGLIAANTSITREGLKTEKEKINAAGSGGLSGKPIKSRSTDVIRYIAQKANKEFLIIGSGGINSVEDAHEKINAGADLVQLYTVFIYEGPGLIKKINRSLVKR
ncbi:MAG: quinone-dependent dihydroorotate dehydrogenase [Bacteroidia bacterium]